jgi:phytoene dehydrogenase-like protein
MHSITTSLYQHALKLGVEFNFDTKIEKLETRSGKIQSASFKGESIGADIFVSNMDVFPFYKNLLPNSKLPEKVLNQERSSSALIFYWGIKKEFKDLILHNILFSENYEEEFNYIFNKKEVYDDPTIYLNISSKHNPSDAPKGKENWFVMINVPSDNGQNWNKIIASCKATILAKINRILKVDVTELIEYENILHPQLIQNKTSSYKGALYGSSSNNKMAAFFRHPNFSRQFSNLYFCGGSVHPGGGIPLALSSAKIVSELID